ncbi:galactokinase [Planctomycetota bacterium]|nr:galactokinase [Planctomycetota bacterium]
MTNPCPIEFGQKAAAKLIELGMEQHEAANKGYLFKEGYELLARKGHALEQIIHSYFTPGRVEFLGKHTDYCGGRSLLCAIERGLCFTVSPRQDSMVNLYRVDSGEVCSFDLSGSIQPIEGNWGNYPMTAAKRLVMNFDGCKCGADVAIASDLPQAAGMSSSSAVIVGMWMILNDINELDASKEYQANIESDEDLAGYMGCIENGQSFRGLTGDKGVGTFGGSQDHTAIMFCECNRLKQFGFGPVTYEQTLAFDDEYDLVIGVCGKSANKTGNAKEKYNRASLLVSELVNIWQDVNGHEYKTLASIVRSENGFESLLCLVDDYQGKYLHGDLRLRLMQFVEESESIIPEVSRLFTNGGVNAIGKLVDRSQFLSSNYLRNQIAHTDFLSDKARELGAIAASAFGAGFGGSVWAMVSKTQTDVFTHAWKTAYNEYDGEASGRATFFITRPGPSASRLF